MKEEVTLEKIDTKNVKIVLRLPLGSDTLTHTYSTHNTRLLIEFKFSFLYVRRIIVLTSQLHGFRHGMEIIFGAGNQ